MSSRTYLSIGDVLTLLRREFPDVTISKIRFLESQGLVDPERTPSGYRKFYEHDVQRLRWVLRQQREHFLPLKVIKGRLEQESSPGRGGNGADAERGHDAGSQGGGEGADSPAQSARSRPAGQITAGPSEGREDPEPVLVGGPARDPEAPTEAGAGRSQMALHPAAAPPGEAHRRPLVAVGEPDRGHAPGLPDQGAEIPTVDSEAHERSASRAPDRRGGSARDRRGQHAQPARALSAVAEPAKGGGSATEWSEATEVAEATGAVERLSHDAGAVTAEAAGAESTIAADQTADDFAGMSMTLEELSQACGLDPRGVQGLESFGLVSSRVIGGVAYYDEDALEAAKIASSFARYGVEPRHLRIHLLAAQREAGFVEQIVLPLFKQRNPASRQKAHDTVSELSGLGQDLRALLLRRTLRDLLGG